MIILVILVWAAILYGIVWFGALVVQALLASAIGTEVAYWPVFWMLVVIALVTWLVTPRK